MMKKICPGYCDILAVTLALLSLLALAGCGRVDDPTRLSKLDIENPEPPPALDTVEYRDTRNLLWGDLHVHTSLSYDAYGMGVRVMPDDAYRYFKGGTISHGAGYAVRAKRPINFAAVTDHAEFLGAPRHLAGDRAEESALPGILATGSPLKITWHWLYTMLTASNEDPAATYGDIPGLDEVANAAWKKTIAAAQAHNDPGRFSAFIAFEYSSMPGGQNLHRNVIFRGSNVIERPFSAIDSENPEDLWTVLEEQRDKGNDNLAIPHNGNASNGLMYDRTTYSGRELDADYAARRMANEPISEIFQVKGSSETHPELSPADPFAAHELFTTIFNAAGDTGKVPGSYARDALRTGLEYQRGQQFNPYQFGVIGSSDSHNGTMADEEDNFYGKQPLMDGTAAQRLGKVFLLPDSVRRTGQWGSQGLAAVWAHENSRDSIFDALRRRETYATTGPRMTLRFFGGWGFDTDILSSNDWIEKAYANGVPMGGELSAYQQQNAPRFVVVSAKDPLGANLDRLQIIKAWVDDKGISHEIIYDIAGAGEREIDPATGLLPAIGSTVNVREATYTNTIGATQLAKVWEDPDFNPHQPAFYYARLIEIPTPRYSTYDAKALGVEAPEPTTIQERAVSSAIWYAPGS
ncbi:MAG: DUF3604 domain-containing protein [Gammaproteobacteria bacterium]|nr:DUF3604 domain-containing protein [Gammaproteobacteria bacterium]